MRKLIIFLSMFIVLGTQISSFGMTYSEDLQGDLLHNDLGVLDLGANTISGTTGVPGDYGATTDLDPFVFTVAPGDLLETITMEVKSEGELYTIWALYEAPFNPIINFDYQNRISLTEPGISDMFQGFSGIEAGRYRLMQSLPVEGSWNADYEITLGVVRAPVPVPGAFLLLGSGLLGLAGIKRKISRA